MFSIEINKVILITPPFVQLNSPYPATQYLSGYLKDQEISTIQYDLSIKTFLRLFSKEGLTDFFQLLEKEIIENSNLSTHISDNKNLSKIYNNRASYISTIDSAITFLQGSNSFISYKIISRDYLPEARRFSVVDDLENYDLIDSDKNNSFDTIEKSKYYCSLYIDDLTDFFNETILPYFGLSKYAEKIASNIKNFDNLYETVLDNSNDDLVTKLFLNEVDKYDIMENDIILLTIPFPGNLFSSLKISYFLKNKFENKNVKIILGGGFVNTELREITDTRIFDFADFITFDDGFLPIKQIIKYLSTDIPLSKNEFIRTITLENNSVKYHNIKQDKNNDIRRGNFSFKLDYENLDFRSYISLSESPNKMYKLWSEKGWNKLYLAHGCYWKRCAFCDTSLDYINNFYPLTVDNIINQIENAIEKTGSNGFHFVDEAMPPNIMRQFAIEIIKRKIDIVWWGNIRFETTFTAELCRLLEKSGCIAVTGGFEVVTDRLLKLMDKGVDTRNVALVCDNFKRNNILVHTYLIYGFPTQTLNEAVDALEIMRQFFHLNLTDSAYWHRFSLTVHSPIAKNRNLFNIKTLDEKRYAFANNDISYTEQVTDKTESMLKNIDKIGDALKKATYNFMFGLETDRPVIDWFEGIKELPKPTLKKNYIKKSIKQNQELEYDKSFNYEKIKRKNILWIGNQYVKSEILDNEYMVITISNDKISQEFEVPTNLGKWIKIVINYSAISQDKNTLITNTQIRDIEKLFPDNLGINFQDFLENELWLDLRKIGLVVY